MNPLLILRSEILSLIILVFLIIYDLACKKYRDGKDSFILFALTAFGHVLFGLITEITVNSLDVPKSVNDTCHVFFFFFALFFSLVYLNYVLSLFPITKARKIVITIASIIATMSVTIMIFSKIDYLEGNGTKYSAGLGPTLCYMLGFIFFLGADIFMLINRKFVELPVLLSILPLSFLGLSLMAIQIVVSEFLFTGAALTIIALGAFFAIENPVGKFRVRGLIDHNTGLYNRNYYNVMIEKYYQESQSSNNHIYYLMGDLNGLKTVNDKYGHMEGDKLISSAADMMTESFKNADKIFRIGGDEFVIIFTKTQKEKIEEEIKAFNEKAKNIEFILKVPLSMSFGLAKFKKDESLEDTVKEADYLMYKNKEQYYKNLNIEKDYF